MLNTNVTFKEFIIDFFIGIGKYDLGNLACQISFRFLLGIFPFILFLLTFFSSMHLDTQYLQMHSDALPDITVTMLQMFINDMSQTTSNLGVISTTFFIAIYSSSKAFKTVIEAVNKIYYGSIQMSLIKRTLLSIFFVFLFLFLVVLPLAYYIFADAIASFLTVFFNFNFGSLSKTNSIILIVCMFVYLTIIVMLMYGLSLGKNVRLRSTIPGAVFCVVFWWFSSTAFNFYVDNFSNYSKIYGSIGTIILFFLWIQLINLVLMIGALINKILYTYKTEDHRLFDSPPNELEYVE